MPLVSSSRDKNKAVDRNMIDKSLGVRVCHTLVMSVCVEYFYSTVLFNITAVAFIVNVALTHSKVR